MSDRSDRRAELLDESAVGKDQWICICLLQLNRRIDYLASDVSKLNNQPGRRAAERKGA